MAMIIDKIPKQFDKIFKSGKGACYAYSAHNSCCNQQSEYGSYHHRHFGLYVVCRKPKVSAVYYCSSGGSCVCSGVCHAGRL